MFDIGWTEMLVVACVAIIVVGPKDLPKMLRTFGKAMGNIRRMAGDFQRQFNDALRETELDEVRKSVTENEAFKPLADAKKSMEDFKKTVSDSMAEKSASSAAKTPTATPAASAETTETVVAEAPKEKSAPSKPAPKPAAKKPAAKKTVAKKPAAKTTGAAKTASKPAVTKRGQA